MQALFRACDKGHREGHTKEENCQTDKGCRKRAFHKGKDIALFRNQGLTETFSINGPRTSARTKGANG